MKRAMCFLVLSLVVPSVVTLRPQSATAQPCTPEWSALAFDGFNGIPQSLAVFDDGQGGGAALYAGGMFDLAGGTPAYIAKWDGQAWQHLGDGVDYFVQAMLVFDDGGGSSLYAGGDFNNADGQPSHGVARWNGQAWSVLPYEGGTVHALAAFDDGRGGGTALYAGDSGGGVARWDGVSWNPLGTLESSVYTLAVFDDGLGGGPALYAGGRFQGAYKWDGTTWQLVGSGINGRVYVLHVFDDGSGQGAALYAGGDFDTADGNLVSRMASWNGLAWSPVGSGVDGEVRSMTVFDDEAGGGPALCVGGIFSNAGKIATPYVASWNGAVWSALDGGTNNLVQSLVAFPGDPGGPALYAGGDFANAGSSLAGRIARWGCTRTTCAGDFNSDDVLNSQDFFDFLAAFFSQQPTADFNNDTFINSQDFFDFLAVFFAGC